MGERRDGRGRRDALCAAALALVFAVLYRLTAQERFANDGPQLASAFVLVPDAVHWQVLYLPLARAVRPLVSALAPRSDPFEALRVIGAVGGGVGVGASFLVARAFGAAPRFALAGALLVALARHAWFFATSVEVHALHFGVVGLAACATLYAPWRRPAIALAVAAAAFALTWTTHATAILLGPGWVALVGFARARVAAPFRVRTLLLAVGPVLLAAYLAVMLVGKAWWVRETGGAADVEWGFLVGYARFADRGRFVLEGLVLPLGLLLPAAAAGIALRMRDPAGWTLLALALPGTLFLLWWAVPEDGGYFLGQAPFHAAAAALFFARLRRRSLLLVSASLLCQGSATWAFLARFDARLHADERAALALDLLGRDGYLGKIAYLAPDVSIWEPDVEDVDLTGRLREGYEQGIEPALLAALVAPALESVLAERAVGLDLSYASERWDLAGPDFVLYVDRFVTELLSRFDVERSSRGGWTLARLRVR